MWFSDITAKCEDCSYSQKKLMNVNSFSANGEPYWVDMFFCKKFRIYVPDGDWFCKGFAANESEEKE